MKVTRKMLLIITASLGGLIIVYALVKQFFGIGLSESLERWAFDTVIIVALGCFMYNRKLAKDEKQAREAAEEAERRAMEEAESGADPANDESPDEDENTPHWERGKNRELGTED